MLFHSEELCIRDNYVRTFHQSCLGFHVFCFGVNKSLWPANWCGADSSDSILGRGSIDLNVFFFLYFLRCIQVLEIIGDIPDKDIKPPDNVLFVCKLNSVTTDEDLEIIFSRWRRKLSLHFGLVRSSKINFVS